MTTQAAAVTRDLALPEISRSSARVPRRDTAGFALAMVVFLLFAVAIAGLTAYQVVSVESELASGNGDASAALTIANAGLHRYVAERISEFGTDTYLMGRGSVTVTPRRLARVNDSTEMYLLEAVGTVTDPRYPTSPATRIVRQYAHLNTMPLRAVAALIAMENVVDLTEPFQVAGNDMPETDDCVSVQGVRFSTRGIAATGTAGDGTTQASASSNTVSPDRYQVGATAAAVVAAAEVRWPAIKDPDFNIGVYDGVMPNFAAIPADSFPVIRMNGNYTLNQAGRGALIVTGFFYHEEDMDWDGIILAGRIDNGTSLHRTIGNTARLRGVLVAGLDGIQNFGGPDLLVQRLEILHNPCYVRKANRSLAYLSLIDGSRWDF